MPTFRPDEKRPEDLGGKPNEDWSVEIDVVQAATWTQKIWLWLKEKWGK